MLDKERRRRRMDLNRKHRPFQKHLRVRVWKVSLSDQKRERRITAFWCSEYDHRLAY